MAHRPIFIPLPASSPNLIQTASVEFNWHAGMSISQKCKSVASLHSAAVVAGYAKKPLEVSSKSTVQIGTALSAFNLSFKSPNWPSCCVEQLFQSSKVFSAGGPYPDIQLMLPRNAKRDARLLQSGPLISFHLMGRTWPLRPRTLFYDWLYLNALGQNPDLWSDFECFDAFTDIEFNPDRSINCQARSVAVFSALRQRGTLVTALTSPEAFANTLIDADLDNQQRPIQEVLL